MLSKTKTIAQLKRNLSKTERRGYVYQFPKGHWGWASYSSPIGQNLRESGFIYPETNVKAQQFEEIQY